MAQRYPVTLLRDFSVRIFLAAGLLREHAEQVSDVLIHASMRGHDSHGLARVPLYVERLRKGMVNARPCIEFLRQAPSFLLVDADNGPGPVASIAAMSRAIAIAREQGVCAAVVAHSNHNGSSSYYVEQAVEAGCVAIAMTNAPPSMAIHGGRTVAIGTNAIAFGTPVAGDAVVLADMATAVAARGKIVERAKRNESIPLGWALDIAGQPTTDAEAAERGIILPMSGHKGSALAIMVETLCGVLSGGRFAGNLGNLYTDHKKTQDIGHFFLVIDTGRTGLAPAYAERMSRLVSELKASETAPNFDRIQMPGEPEAERAVLAGVEGIELAENTVKDLNFTAAGLQAEPLL